MTVRTRRPAKGAPSLRYHQNSRSSRLWLWDLHQRKCRFSAFSLWMAIASSASPHTFGLAVMHGNSIPGAPTCRWPVLNFSVPKLHKPRPLINLLSLAYHVSLSLSLIYLLIFYLAIISLSSLSLLSINVSIISLSLI
jgi:hypothetical protein